MESRSAHSTLLGYLYQFDKTIFEIMRLAKATEKLCIEGIEDVDIQKGSAVKAVQCKYFASQTYFPSKLREPISSMLEHFLGAKSEKFAYHLYLYFKDFRSLPKSFDLDELKSILTYTPKGKSTIKVYENLGATDKQLEAFCKKLRVERATNFDDQHKSVVQSIKSQFSCDSAEAEAFYYSNALKFVFETATKSEITERTVSKSKFLTAIDSKEMMFSTWLVELKGKQEYFRMLRKQLKQRKSLQSQKSKGILLHRDLLASDKVSFERFCGDLISAFYSKGHHRIDAMPWTLIVDVDLGSAKEYKKELLRAEVFFTDGYEHVEFTPSMFNRRPIKIKAQTRTGKATEQLADSSYFLKIITAETFRANFKAIESLDVFFCDSKTDLSKFFLKPNSVDVIRVDSIRTLTDLSEVLF